MKNNPVLMATVGVAVGLGALLTVMILVAVGMSAFGGDRSAAASTSSSTQLNATRGPEIAGRTVSGQVINVADHAGKIIVVDFWATWCGPCIAKMPQMVALVDKYEDRDDVYFLGVSGDRDPQALQKFEQDNNLPFQSIYEGADKVYRRYGITGIPTVLIFDKSGRLAYEGRGDIGAEIEKLLAKG